MFVCPGHEAGAQAGAGGGVCGRAEGDLCPVQDEPSQGEEARDQEVVLCALPGVGSVLTRPLPWKLINELKTILMSVMDWKHFTNN